jgi:hypothetical protein
MLYVISYSSHRSLKGFYIVTSAVQSTRAPLEQVDVDLFDPPPPGHALSMRRHPDTKEGMEMLDLPSSYRPRPGKDWITVLTGCREVVFQLRPAVAVPHFKKKLDPLRTVPTFRSRRRTHCSPRFADPEDLDICVFLCYIYGEYRSSESQIHLGEGIPLFGSPGSMDDINLVP